MTHPVCSSMNETAHSVVPAGTCATADVGAAGTSPLGAALVGTLSAVLSACVGCGDDATGAEHAKISAASIGFNIRMLRRVPEPCRRASVLHALTLTGGLRGRPAPPRNLSRTSRNGSVRCRAVIVRPRDRRALVDAQLRGREGETLGGDGAAVRGVRCSLSVDRDPVAGAVRGPI